VVRKVWPAEGRTVLGVQTLSLLPGVNLTDVGRVKRVDHWIMSGSLSSWAWV
jgi:hypothetical protein